MRRPGPRTIAAKTYDAPPAAGSRPHNVPLVLSTNFQFSDHARMTDSFRARRDDVYQRFGHPNHTSVEAKLAALEGAERALVFSSGMAAITTALLAHLEAGDHVVCQRQVFGQTYRFLDRFCRRLGVETTFVRATDLEELAAALRPETRIVYVETPSNPLLDVVDLAAVAELARARGALFFVDSTFASPALQRPLEHGASLVLHSASKYLNGHSDVLAGAVAGARELLAPLYDLRYDLGCVLDPHASWLLGRGLRTLSLRVERSAATAEVLARELEGSDVVEEVRYPFLEGFPGNEVARRQMSAGGGMLSFRVRGGRAGARAFVGALTLVPVATSLGDVESIVEIPRELDFEADELGLEENETLVPPGLIRLSVGIEDLDDLRDDLRRGVDALRRHLDGARTAVAE